MPPSATVSDSFGFTIRDGHGGFSSARANITVLGVNDPPVVAAAGVTAIRVLEHAGETNLTAALLAGATDADPGETAGLQLVSIDAGVTVGLVTFTNGVVTYSPNHQFETLTEGQTNLDSFNYSVQDSHGAISIGTAQITIVGENNPPKPTPAFTSVDDGSAPVDLTALLLAPVSDPDDGETATLRISGIVETNLSSGLVELSNGIVTYHPPSLYLAAGQFVTNAFLYAVQDVHGATSNGVAVIYIIGVNSPPVAKDAQFSVNEDQLLEGSVTGSDGDGDSLTFAVVTSPAHGSLALNTNGVFTYRPNANFNGTDSFTFKANDSRSDSPPATLSITVTPANDPPGVASSPPTQSLQHSDPIAPVTILASDMDSPGSTLVAATSWSLNGGAFTPGLPDNLTLTQVNTSANARAWTLAGVLQGAPGNYVVRVEVTDDGGLKAARDTTLIVSPEDARATFTGALFASTASPDSGAATVTLAATIQDITAVIGDPAYDPIAGDIRNARVTFVNRDNNTIIASNLPVGLVASNDLRTGTAVYNWNVNIGTANSQSFTVGILVDRYYTRNASEDNTVVTVSRPLTSDFVTGGGYLTITRPGGLVPGGIGTKANFGFNVKYNKSARSLQGAINIILRNGGRVYQIKGNAMTSLSTTGNKGTFNGKANIQDITDPLASLSIDGKTSWCAPRPAVAERAWLRWPHPNPRLPPRCCTCRSAWRDRLPLAANCPKARRRCSTESVSPLRPGWTMR